MAAINGWIHVIIGVVITGISIGSGFDSLKLFIIAGVIFIAWGLIRLVFAKPSKNEKKRINRNLKPAGHVPYANINQHTKFCRFCGARVGMQDRFCQQCGGQLFVERGPMQYR